MTSRRWPHLTALLEEEGGRVALGRAEPLGAAVAMAATARRVPAVLCRRPGEGVGQLLGRLEATLEQIAHGGKPVDELMGLLILGLRLGVGRFKSSGPS